jgi:hypothetical protein
MSQEPPNSQPPSPEPEAQTQTAAKVQTSQQSENSFQTVLKAQTVKVLRGTIQVLEGVAVKLEEGSPTTTPTWLDKLQGGWSAVLVKIRSVLPSNLSSKLSNTALTGIIAGISIILVWTTSVLPGKPTEVAVPPASPEPAVPSPSPSITTSPEPSVPSPSPNITTPPEPEPIPSIPTPPELTSPAEPQPIEVIPSPEPEPTPPPTVELTPEQTLIAAIENQVAGVSDRFAAGLIQSIQVNFAGSSLTLKLSDDWYNLEPSQQDNLAAKMLEQSRELDFSRLEVTDPQGKLLARSPVVGKDMVILRRQM